MPESKEGFMEIVKWILKNLVLYKGEVFQYLAIAIALVTAFVTLLNVGLTRRSIRSSYRPRIFPSNSHYVMKQSDELVPYIVEIDRDEDSLLNYAMHLAPSAVRNVVLGSAVNIEIKWKYSRQKMSDYFETNGGEVIEKSEQSQDHFTYRKEAGGPFGFVLEEPKQYDKNIASVVAGEEYKIYLPETLLNYISFQNMVRYRVSDERRFEYEIDDVKLEIDYKDIGGSSHTQMLKLHINVYTHFRRDATYNSDHSIITVEYL